jgi:outer membrane protein assembly factor BamE
MRVLSVVLGATLVLSLSGCFLFHPYKIQIQQGHVITAEMVKTLKPGMTEDQVQYILGTPDIQDPMHPDVWYYIYTNEAHYLPRVQKQLVVYFKNGQLDHMEGNYPPPTPLQVVPSVTAS